MAKRAIAARRDGYTVLVRLEGMRPGTWLTEISPIDAILNHIRRELRIVDYHGCNILTAIGMSATAISRYRLGRTAISAEALVRLADYSGIPLAELRLVGCIEQRVAPHPQARTA